MLLIPAIDIKDRKCVRLREGRMDTATVFSDDPVAMAARWVEAGARRLHIVDLDGAVAGEPKNAGVVRDVVDAHPDVPVQIGGGIRDEETVESYVQAGVRFVILGTRAAAAPHFIADLCVEFPGHVIVGLDTRDGKIAVDGWSKAVPSRSRGSGPALRARRGRSLRVHRHRPRRDDERAERRGDGRSGARGLGAGHRLGGIRNLDDVRALCAVAGEGIAGAITGRAIYEGALDFAEAQRLADELAPD